ncbi:hypothetical protein KSS87_006186 [Heliosperma pusillum]|nr:hypothetical protein KSS87_006186 [Heliosperma pusillum]
MHDQLRLITFVTIHQLRSTSVRKPTATPYATPGTQVHNLASYAPPDAQAPVTGFERECGGHNMSSSPVHPSRFYMNHDYADLEELKPSLWQDLADVALKQYNEKQGTNLERFGEAASNNPLFREGVCCFHLDFEAKPKDDIESSPKKIFSEVFRSRKGEVRVAFCGVMDPSNPELLKGCRECSKKVLHPPGMKFFEPTKAFGLGSTSG